MLEIVQHGNILGEACPHYVLVVLFTCGSTKLGSPQFIDNLNNVPPDELNFPIGHFSTSNLYKMISVNIWKRSYLSPKDSQDLIEKRDKSRDHSKKDYSPYGTRKASSFTCKRKGKSWFVLGEGI
jgi:hypothetical protein